MKRAAIAFSLLLAACGSSPEAQQPASEGNALRETINKQSVSYGECVTGAINSIEIKGRVASVLADEAFVNCRPKRETLLEEIYKFRRLGHPSEPEANSRVTAEQSVLNLDADLRETILVAATKRRLAEGIEG